MSLHAHEAIDTACLAPGCNVHGTDDQLCLRLLVCVRCMCGAVSRCPTDLALRGCLGWPQLICDCLPAAQATDLNRLEQQDLLIRLQGTHTTRTQACYAAHVC